MAIILQKSRFLHVPKTGGTWVTRALDGACTVQQDFRIRGSDHTPIEQSPHPEKFTFAFVRHPLTWWQSLWRFHRGPARRYVVSHEVCSQCWSEDFGEFMRSVLGKFPGEDGNIVEKYLGPIGAGMSFVGRQELLVSDLLLALQLAGEPHDEGTIWALDKTNVSDRRLAADYTPELAGEVMEAERAVAERFGYWGPARDPAAACAWIERLPSAT